MSLSQEVLETIDLAPGAYFDFSEQTAELLEQKLIALERFDSIYIAAPDTIDITAHSTLPVLKAIQYGDVRAWEVDELRNLIAVAYNHTTGELYAGPARRDTKQRDYSSRDHPEELPQDIDTEGYGTECRVYDLKSALTVPWEPSGYSVTMLCYDWVSNQVEVRLRGEEPAKGAMRVPAARERVVDAVVRGGESALAPEVSFTVPPETKRDLENFTIQGTFRLPVLETNVVSAELGSMVVIPIDVMLVKKNLDQSSPIVCRLWCKTETGDTVETNPYAEGIIKTNIRDLSSTLATHGLEAREYCCYMVVQGTCFGPRKVLVRE